MSIRCWSKSVGRAAAAFAVALALSGAAPVQPASAQGLFEALFGGFNQRRAPLPHRATAYFDPFFGDDRPQRRASADHHGGPSSGFCVRTCDGRFFPVRASGGMSAAELCKSFCPAAKTKIFSGGKIDHSVASDGTRYADLDNAFLYRERTVDNCTCNGKDGFGLAPLDAASDPTLRPGDIVATNEGLVTFSGNRKSNTAEFTPIEKSGGSNEWHLRLRSIKVTPAPERAEAPPVAPVADKTAERADRRRAQR